MEASRARDGILEHLSNKLSDRDRRKLGEIPGREEVEATLKMLSSRKSPGPDGVTTEVLVACWDFIVVDVFAMIHYFWDMG